MIYIFNWKVYFEGSAKSEKFSEEIGDRLSLISQMNKVASDKFLESSSTFFMNGDVQVFLKQGYPYCGENKIIVEGWIKKYYKEPVKITDLTPPSEAFNNFAMMIPSGAHKNLFGENEMAHRMILEELKGKFDAAEITFQKDAIVCIHAGETDANGFRYEVEFLGMHMFFPMPDATYGNLTITSFANVLSKCRQWLIDNFDDSFNAWKKNGKFR